MRGLVTCNFAGALLCGVERRRCFVLGKEWLWPGDAFLEMLFKVAVALFERRGGGCTARLILCLLIAGWRRLDDQSELARGGCWVEQRR